jgi:hypothetical protein
MENDRQSWHIGQMTREHYIARLPSGPWEIVMVFPDGKETVVEFAATKEEAEARALVLDRKAEREQYAGDAFPQNRRDRDS